MQMVLHKDKMQRFSRWRFIKWGLAFLSHV